MASVKNGLSENIKGRLGNVIFYSRLGRTYARLRPPKGHDPCTVLQQQQRSRMKDVTLFYKVVRQSPLAGIWRQAAYAQGMTGIDLFVKSNIAAFSGNGRVTDYEKLHFSFGGLPQGDCFRVVGGSSGISLDIYWENATLLNEGRCADRFMAVVLFENDEFIAYTDLGSIYPRIGCHALIRLPEGYPRPRRVYCFFAAVNGKDYSGDVCCEVEN